MVRLSRIRKDKERKESGGMSCFPRVLTSRSGIRRKGRPTSQEVEDFAKNEILPNGVPIWRRESKENRPKKQVVIPRESQSLAYPTIRSLAIKTASNPQRLGTVSGRTCVESTLYPFRRPSVSASCRHRPRRPGGCTWRRTGRRKACYRRAPSRPAWSRSS